VPLSAALAASAVSQVGNQLTLLAVPWFVLETTGSAGKTGLTGAVVVVAVVLAAFFGGALVDHVGFKRASVLADLASGATVALIPLLHHTIGLAYWQLLALVFLGAVLDAPGAAARQSLYPDLAALAGVRLDRANAAAQVVWRVSYLAGPPLAGVLIALLGTSNVLWLDAGSFAVSAGLTALLVPARPTRVPALAPAQRPRAADLMAGLGVIRGDRLILVLAIASTLGNALGGAFLMVALPVYANRVLDSATAFGLLLGAFGAGALLSSLAFGAVGYRWPRRRILVASQLVALAPVWIVAATPPLAALLAALVLEGLSAGPFGPIVSTAYQQRVPAELRGRFFGTVLALDNATTPLAVLAMGVLLDHWRFEAAVAALALCSLVVTVGFVLQPALAELDEVGETALTPRFPLP
jgi:MFS family permease